MTKIVVVAFVFFTFGPAFNYAEAQPAVPQIDADEAISIMRNDYRNKVMMDQLSRNPAIDRFLSGDALDIGQLELVASQRTEIDRIRSKFEHMLSELEQGLENSRNDPKSTLAINREIQKTKVDFRRELVAVMLPHQIEMLANCNLTKSGLSQVVAGSLVGQALDLSEAQKKRITDKSHRLAEKIESFIHEIRQEANDVVLDELSDQQKEQLFEILGKQNVLDYSKRVPMTLLFHQNYDREQLDNKVTDPLMLIRETDVKLKGD